MFFVIKLRNVLWMVLIIVVIFSLYKLNEYIPTINPIKSLSFLNWAKL